MRFPARVFALHAMLSVGFTAIVAAQSAQAPTKTRIFITDSESWAAVGGFGAASGTAAGGSAAGSSPQTVEVINDFAKNCPTVIVTNDRSAADYVVLFDRDALAKAKTNLARADKIAVFKKQGDLVYSGKTRSVANAVKDACAALATTKS